MTYFLDQHPVEKQVLVCGKFFSVTELSNKFV